MKNLIVYFLVLICTIILTLFTTFGGILLVLCVVFPVVGMIMNCLEKDNITADFENLSFEKGENVLIKINIRGKGNYIVGRLKCENCLTLENKFLNFKGFADDNLTIEIQFNSEHCGRIRIDFESLKRYDFFHLTYKNMKSEISGIALCLPELIEYRMNDFSHSDEMNNLETVVENLGYTDHSEINQIRNYRQGDSYKDIHWKLSFRLQDLFVREYSTEKSVKICLCLVESDVKNNIEFSETAEKILSVSYLLFAQNKQHFIAVKGNVNDEIYFDFVSNNEDYIVAQTHILSACPLKVSKNINEFSQFFVKNNITEVAVFKNNGCEIVDLQ